MKKILKKLTKGVLIFLALIAVVIGVRIVLGLILNETEPIPNKAEETLRARARKLHFDSLVIDSHNDLPTWMLDFEFDLGMNGNEPGDTYPFFYYRESPVKWIPGRPSGDTTGTHTDLTRMKEGGLDAQFFSIWPDCTSYQSETENASLNRALDMIKVLSASVEKNRNAIEFAYSAQDIKHLAETGKIEALMGLEGGHAIENNLENLKMFFDRGIRYMTLTHNCTNDWADSSTDEAVNNGLSEFGKDVIKEMNRLGMMVDVSHVSDKTFWDVIKITKAPIIASHSNSRVLVNRSRNMSDDMVKAVAENNGVVITNFMTYFLDNKIEIWKLASGWHWFINPRTRDTTPLSNLINHIDHLVKVAGINHVGALGSDFDGTPFLPKNLKDVSDIPNITIELMRRGYSDTDIRKLLGGNLMRVFADVENVAQNLN